MKTFIVNASQLVFYEKVVQAETPEEAEEIAFESSNDKWREIEYSDWQLEQTKEIQGT